MAQLSKKHVRELLAKQSGKLKVSLYIPTNPVNTGDSVAADRTRFKNALQVVRNHDAYDERELGATLDTIYEELYENAEFWNHQDFSLAVLFNADGYEYFHIPYEITEQEYVLDHYIVSPLLIAVSADTGFYLLDVNLTRPRLYRGARGRLYEVHSNNLPGTFDDEVGRDEYKAQLQHQSGGGSAFHGHTDDGAIIEDLRRYLKLIASSVDTALDGLEKPLILAGTTNRTGNVRNELTYPHVLDTTLDGNYETANTDELYELASPIVRDYLRSKRDGAVEKLAGTAPEYVVIGRSEIEEAADTGRVDTLFLPTYRVTRDSVRPDADETLVIDLPSDIEEIETIVTKVLLQSGDITAVARDTYAVLSEPKALCRY